MGEKDADEIKVYYYCYNEHEWMNKSVRYNREREKGIKADRRTRKRRKIEKRNKAVIQQQDIPRQLIHELGMGIFHLEWHNH